MLVILPWKLLTIAVYNPIWSHFSLQHPPLWRPPCKWNVATQPLKRTLAEWVGGCQLSLMSGCCFKKNAGWNASNSWRILTLDWLFTQLGGKNGVPYFTHHPPKKNPSLSSGQVLVLLGTSLTMESGPEGALFTGAPISSASPKCIQQHHPGRIL